MLVPDEDRARPLPCWNQYLTRYYEQQKSEGPKRIEVLHRLRNRADAAADSDEFDGAGLRAGFEELLSLSQDLHMPLPAASSIDNWRPGDDI